MGKSFIIHTNTNTFSDSFVNKTIQALEINQKNKIDILEVDIEKKKQSISIKQVKDLLVWAKLKPFIGSNKLAIVYKAEKLTLEAQNALLKFLEEPFEAVTIILITSKLNDLLPTVKSRCIILESHDDSLTSTDFFKKSFVEQFKFIESFLKESDKNLQKEKTIQFLESLLLNRKEFLQKSNNAKNQILVIAKTIKMLENNVSIKLSLENLIIQLQ